MRADARRNYDRILTVASALFAERGTDASLDEIAKRAGVGPGTLYRHFPTRERLIDAAMTVWIDGIQSAADRAMTSERPQRELLLTWLEDFVAHISQYRGGPARLIAAMDDPDAPIYPRWQVLARANAKVLDHLVAAGALRDSVDALQICRLVFGVATVADQGKLDASAIRSLLAIIADGLLR